jgi:toxin ParE1/3/4
LAIRDLEAALDYLQSERASAIGPVLARIEASLQALLHHPELGRAGRVGGTRELLVIGTPFILAYRKKAERLEILAFIHGARRWPESF